MVKHIVCIGAVYIDTILSVPKYPIEDQKLRATAHTRRRGGNCANTLEVLSQLAFQDVGSPQVSSQASSSETQIHLLTVLPNKGSAAVQFVRDSLEHVLVDASCIFRPDSSEAASSYIIQNAQNNSRTIVSHNPLQEMTTDEFVVKASQLVQTDKKAEGIYHFEGRIPDVTGQCLEYLRSAREQRNFKISVECEKPERDYMFNVSTKADIVFYSKLWAQGNNYDNPKSFLENSLKSTTEDALLCCTWGAEGAVAVQKKIGEEDEWAEIRAWHPNTGPADVVDTIGAGDTFIAGMLYALNHYADWTLKQKLAIANELAGRKVRQEGFQGLVAKMRASANVALI